MDAKMRERLVAIGLLGSLLLWAGADRQPASPGERPAFRIARTMEPDPPKPDPKPKPPKGELPPASPERSG